MRLRARAAALSAARSAASPAPRSAVISRGSSGAASARSTTPASTTTPSRAAPARSKLQSRIVRPPEGRTFVRVLLTNQYACTTLRAMRQARRAPPRPARPKRRPERRPQQRSLETRERLVEAALQVFASHGFDGATTREIARRAGVALAALPYHFTTKEALWKAAADRIFGQLGEAFGRRLAGLEGVDARTRLRLILRDFVRFQAAHPQLHRFMIQEGIARTPRLAWLVDTHIRPSYEFVRATIEEAQRSGLVPLGNPAHLHYMLIGAASSVYALAAEFELLTGASPSDEALVAEHVATLERMF